MSISPIDESTATSVTDASAQVKLERDQKKLAADIAARASQAQIAADNAAVITDQLAVAAAASPGVDTYL